MDWKFCYDDGGERVCFVHIISGSVGCLLYSEASRHYGRNND